MGKVFKCGDLTCCIYAGTHVLISTDTKGEQEGLTRKTRPHLPKDWLIRRGKFHALDWKGEAGTQMTQRKLIGKVVQKSRRETTRL